MSRKILGIFIVMLLITATALSVGENNIEKGNHICYIINETSSSGFPDDFNFIAHCGGFHPLESLFKLSIDSNGEASYYILFPEDRETEEWTLTAQFDLSQSQMNQIWDRIILNDFFNLDDLYQDDEILDGSYAEMTINADNTKTVRTENIFVPQFDNIVKLINSITPGDNDLYYNAVYNYRPFTPSTPTGETNGKSGDEYTYQTVTNDDNTDQLYYLFDWGDGTDSGWVGPFNSGETATAKHIWDEQGNYSIMVKAKDDPDSDGDLSDGKESEWSGPLSISMPKNKRLLTFNIKNFLIRLLDYFKFLDFGVQNNFEQEKDISTTSSSYQTTYQSRILNLNADSGTRVTIDECDISVDLYIELWGEAANETNRANCENNIEEVWNKDINDPWRIQCKEDCDPREPGCRVTFDAHVETRGDNTTPRAGYHQIQMVPGPQQSSVMGRRTADTNDRVLDRPRPNGQALPTTTGTWDDEDHLIDTFAHEAGHLMGLDDTYPPHKVGYGDHIMNNNGAVKQEDIDLIIEMSGIECPCKCCPELNWWYHFYSDYIHPDENKPCEGGDLKVWATHNCTKIVDDPIWHGYTPACRTVYGPVPPILDDKVVNDIVFEFEWDYICENVDYHKFVKPDWDEPQDRWRLVPLATWLYDFLWQDRVIPTIGDPTGDIQNIYTVVDLGEFFEDPRPPQDVYEITDGECPDLPGFLIGTTPITFNPQAGPDENPFGTTRLNGVLYHDGEVTFSFGEYEEEEIYCTDFEDLYEIYENWMVVDGDENPQIDTWTWWTSSYGHCFHCTQFDTYLSDQLDYLMLNIGGSGLDVSSYDEVELCFDHYCAGESEGDLLRDYGYVEVSFDGFTTPGTQISPGYYDNDWEEVCLTIDTEGEDALFIRWVWQSDSTFTNTGWYIDDVCIYGK